MQRKNFLKGFAGTGFLCYAFPVNANPGTGETQMDKELVKEFVGKAHSDMDTVRSLLKEHPTLLNAAHDWERGDFETALGAASHVGHVELASYLLEKGAQTNIFTACLFGKTDLVKTLVEAFPHSLHAKGPHGYTLLHHAEQGGDSALEVKEYLLTKGLREQRIPLF